MARPKESERDAQRLKTRQRLLEAAAMEFSREGYHGANINRISLAAGYAKGTIYNYFPTKKDLMLTLITELSHQHYEWIVALTGQETDPRRRLIRFFEAGFSYVSSRHVQALVLINNLFGPHTEFKEQMFQAYQPMFQHVATDILAPGISSGLFVANDVQTLTNLVMTIYLGVASQTDQEGRPWFEPEMVADFCLRALTHPTSSPSER